MKVTFEQTMELLTGNQQFKQLGFSMMITRMKMTYAKNPTRSFIESCVAEINAFLDKFKAIMGADYEIVKRL